MKVKRFADVRKNESFTHWVEFEDGTRKKVLNRDIEKLFNIWVLNDKNKEYRSFEAVIFELQTPVDL